MNHDHDQCRTVLLRFLLEALAEHADLIRPFESEHRTSWCSGLCGISYDILPSQPFVSISFRTASDSDPHVRHRPNESTWKGYNLIGWRNAGERLRSVEEYVHQLWKHVSSDPEKCQEVNHLIFLAAAESLLDPKVAELLRQCSLPASIITDQVPYSEFGTFDYVVVDEDRVFDANYCEIVCAMRVARRLLGRIP
jgi:hypothetical protein